MKNTSYCTLATLKRRAQYLDDIRLFFKKHDILEVETPLLSQHTVTDPEIESFAIANQQKTYYLQTSPEYAMKRLLAQFKQSIFQISKAFREEQVGSLHNPEFTLLEWYEVGINHHQLMQRLDQLLQAVAKTPAAKKISYLELFKQNFDINPYQINLKNLEKIAKEKSNYHSHEPLSFNLCCQLLLHSIEKKLGDNEPLFIYDYPASQAALAKLDPTQPHIAQRFECYYQGIELANGFYELNNPNEQQQRFEQQQQLRKNNQQPCHAIDDRLIASLNDLPDCAGVALGLDRLLMILLQQHHIQRVISFDYDHA